MNIYVQKHGETLGPLSEDQVRLRTQTGIIAAEDLASTSGGAPWQPVSTLMSLDVIAPSPVPAVERSTIESDSAESEHTNETILYQDSDKFLASRPFEDRVIPANPRVTIMQERLIVGDNSYLLDGVASVSLTSPLKRIYPATLTKRISCWLWFWLSFIPLGYYCWIKRGQPSRWTDLLPWIVFCGLPYVLAKIATRRDKKQRYHQAEIILTQAIQSTRIFVGAFRQAPGWISEERDLWKSGVTGAAREKAYKLRTAYFDQSVARTEQIAEALKQVIQRNKPVVSK